MLALASLKEGLKQLQNAAELLGLRALGGDSHSKLSRRLIAIELGSRAEVPRRPLPET